MSKENNIIDIYCFGLNQKLFQNLFKKKKENDDKQDFGIIEKRNKVIELRSDLKIHEYFIPFFLEFLVGHKKYYWNGYNYPDILDGNKNKILFDLYKRIENKNSNAIIIKFGNSYIKEFSILMDKIKKDKPFILFLFKDNEINQDELKLFKKPEYISYMKYEDEEDKIKSNIISYIWKKQYYFYEYGYDHDLFFSTNFIECNILLIGESRSGKSSFINRIFNKLVSHEGGNLESVTNKIRQYKYSLENEENDIKGTIKFIDTPGMINQNNFKQIRKELDKYFSIIHIIYFFIKGQSNLEHCIDMLKYIKENNRIMIKNKKGPIPIIFIKNGEDLTINNEKPQIFQYLKGELKKYNLFELYDPKIEIKKEINEINEENFLEEEEELDNNYDNYIEGNIIQVHIPKGKNLNKIFMISKEYLINNNKYMIDKEDEEFIQIKEDTKQLIQYFIKEKFENKKLNSKEDKERKFLLKKCNDYFDKIKNKCSFLYNYELFQIKKGINPLICIPFYILLTPIALASIFLPLFFGYGINKLWDFLGSLSFFHIGIRYGFDENDLEYYGLKKYLISFNNKIINDDKKEKEKKEIMKNVEEKIDNQKDDEKTKIIKIDNENNEDKNCISEKKVRELIESNYDFFEKLLLYIGPIQCLIKGKEISLKIFDLFEKLKNRKEKDWISFNVKEIKSN